MKPFKNLFGSTLELKCLEYILKIQNKYPDYKFEYDVYSFKLHIGGNREKSYKVFDKFVNYNILIYYRTCKSIESMPDSIEYYNVKVDYYIINLESPIVQAFQTINNFLNEEK